MGSTLLEPLVDFKDIAPDFIFVVASFFVLVLLNITVGCEVNHAYLQWGTHAGLCLVVWEH